MKQPKDKTQYTFPDGTTVDFANQDPQEILDAFVAYQARSQERSVLPTPVEPKDLYKEAMDKGVEATANMLDDYATKRSSEDKIEALNKAGVPKWLIEVMKSYDGLMSTNPDKEHKWIAKRRLAKDIQDQLTLLLLEIIGEDEDEAKHIINGKAVGKNADAHTRNQLRAELRAKLTKGVRQ